VIVNWIEKNKAMKRPCLWDVVRGSWMGFAIGLALIAGNAQAQTGSAGSSVPMDWQNFLDHRFGYNGDVK
jgi:hypothetical protein